MTTVITPQAPVERSSRARLSGLSRSPAVELKALTRADEGALMAMLDRCSRTSLFRRFHSYTDGRAYMGSLFGNGSGQQTVLAWYGAICIGVGNLMGDTATSADLGVLVEDTWQRRGVGTRLVSALFDSARTIGVTNVHADVLGDDQFILRTLRKLGPLRVSLSTGTYSVDIDLDQGRHRRTVQ
jgi:GNAT superfamily N-acetyltransferase